MSCINATNRDAWQELANRLGTQCPSKGKIVKVIGGRKHLDKIGKVTWHGVDRFASRRYETEAQAQLRDLRGRYGFRVRIDTGDEQFFIGADQVEVLS